MLMVILMVTSGVLKGNFDPSTDYEWHTKAWCTGNVDSDGNSDPMYHSVGEISLHSLHKHLVIRCQLT